MPSRVTLKWTFKPFLSWNQRFLACSLHEIKFLFLLSEMDILAVMCYLEMNIQTFFKLKSALFSLKYKPCSFLSEMDMFSVTHYLEMNIQTILSWNRRLLACSLHEIKFLFLSEWNGHSCRHALPWNERWNLYWAEIGVFKPAGVAWNKTLFISKWYGLFCRHMLPWNQYSNLFLSWNSHFLRLPLKTKACLGIL